MTKTRKTPPGTVAVAIAAKFFGVSDKHIYNLLDSGDIPQIRWNKRRLLSGEWFADMQKVWPKNITHSHAYELTRQALLFRSQNGTREEPAQLELTNEEAPRKISKEEIPAFRCIYPEKLGCTEEGSGYDLNLDCDLRDKQDSPFYGMTTVKCHNMERIEGFGKWGGFYCNREAPAEWFYKYYKLKDPRRVEIQRLRDEASAKAAKADDLESELANG